MDSFPAKAHHKKNPFKFTNVSQTFLQNLAQKNNTEICNSSTHPVKGHIPYCSQSLMHSISQNWQEVHSLWFRTANLKQNKKTELLSTVQSWKMQFLTDKLVVFPRHSEDHKIHKLSQTPLSFHWLSRPSNVYPISPKLLQTFKDHANPVVGWGLW